MQAYNILGSVSARDTTLATLGCPVPSPQPSQINDHGSLQQYLSQQQTGPQEAVSSQNHSSSGAFSLAPAPKVLFDPNSRQIFAIAQADEAQSLEAPNTGGQAAILQVNAVAACQKLEAPKPEATDAVSFERIPTLQQRNFVESQVLHQLAICQQDTNAEPSAEGAPAPTLNMRFSEALSTPKMDISKSGLTVTATQKSQRAVTTHCFRDGIAYCEFNCPIRCSGLVFGCTTGGKSPKDISQTFHSSTMRTVTVVLNFKEQEVKFFINQRYFKKLKSQKLKYTGVQWHFYVEFKEPHNYVILNPAARYPVPDSQLMQLQTKLPLNLWFEPEHVLLSLIAQKLSKKFVVIGSQDKFKTPAEYKEKLMKCLPPNIKVDFTTLQQKVDNAQMVAIGDAESEKQVMPAIQHIAGANCGHEYIDNIEIAKLVLVELPEFSDCSFKNTLTKTSLASRFTICMSLATQYGGLKLKQELYQWLGLLEKNQEVSSDKLKEIVKAIQDDDGQLPRYKQAIQAADKEKQHKVQTELSADGDLIVATGCNLKMFKPAEGRSTQDFTKFQSAPQSPADEIYLKITEEQLRFLASKLTNQPTDQATTSYTLFFWQAVVSSFDGNCIKLPYHKALMAVQTMLRDGVCQFQKSEAIGNKLAIFDCNETKKFSTVNQNQENQTLSNQEMHFLLSILLSLEDQLYSMTFTASPSASIKRLWPSSTFAYQRVHTGLGRIASLLNFQDSENPFELAALGLYNTADEQRQLQHYQDFNVQIESVYQKATDSTTLQSLLEKQLPNSQLLKGLPTWNVPLEQSINNLPTSQHIDVKMRSADQNRRESPLPIDQLATAGDFCLSGNKEHGSINIWSRVLGLVRIGQHNFFSQMHQIRQAVKQEEAQEAKEESKDELIQEDKGSMVTPESQKLIWKSYPKAVDDTDNGITVYCRRSRPMTEPKLFKEDSIKPSEEYGEEEGKEGTNPDDEDFFFNMFKPGTDLMGSSYVDVKSDQTNYDTEEWLDDIPEDFNELNVTKAVFTPIKFAGEPSPAAEPKPEEQKKASKAVDEAALQKLRDHKKKLNTELLTMGFTQKLIDAAWDKINKATGSKEPTKAIDLQEMLDILLTVQEEAPAKKEAEQPKPEEEKTEEITWASYSCVQCTFINDTNPLSMCCMCGFAAPESAKIVTKIEPKVDLAKVAAEEARKEKERIEQEKERERQERMLLAKREREQLIKDARAETETYYTSFKVNRFLLATNEKGYSKKPILVGAVMEGQEKVAGGDETKNYVDFTFKWFRMHRFQTTNGQDIFQWYETHKWAVLGLMPRIYGGNPLVRASEIGTARLQLDKLHSVVQLTEQIASDKPFKLLVIGERQQKPVQMIVKVNTGSIIQVKPIAAGNTVVCDENLATTQIYRGGENKVLTHSNGSLTLYKQTGEDVFESAKTFKLADASLTLIGCSNGLASLQSSDSKTVSTFMVEESESASSLAKQEQKPQSNQLIDEADVLKMQIDPTKITIGDIDRYESLMKGSTTFGTSNASSEKGSNDQKNYVRHQWDLSSGQRAGKHDGVRPLQFKLQKPTSLLSLNVNLNFKCTDTAKFIEHLDPSVAAEQEESKEAPVSPDAIDIQMTDSLAKSVSKQASSVQLGQFTLKAFSQDSQDSAANSGLDFDKIEDEAALQEAGASKQQQMQQYLPLLIVKNKGACYSHSLYPEKMLVNQLQGFASNYPKPEVTFGHQYGEQILVDKITITTPINSKFGAYPMGEGMIFLSDTLQPFEQTDAFNKFTLQDYNTWKDQRLKDQRPLRANEPVAYFQLDENLTLTFEIDFKRPARYIMLKPTGFRQKPYAFNQNVDIVPMEIQFFGATGQAQAGESSAGVLEQVSVYDTAQNLVQQQQIQSGFSCEVTLLDGDQVVAKVDNFKIDQIRSHDTSVSIHSLTTNNKQIASTCALEGLSLIRMTDSSLQMQTITGVSISVNRTSQSHWQLQSAQVEGIEAKVSESQNVEEQKLFSHETLPACYYRSCLMSPKYFSVINKQIAGIVSSEVYSLRLRMRAMLFLQKLIRVDNRFSQLISQEINLDGYLKANIFSKDQQLINQAETLLQSFQGDAHFAQTLFEIAVHSMDSVLDKVYTYNGYEALIGIMKWAMPLDYQRAIDVLCKTLIQKLAFDYVPAAQTDMNVKWRTMISRGTDLIKQSPYPFDKVPFRIDSPAENADAEQSNDQPSTALKRPDLIRQFKMTAMKKEKNQWDKFYSLEFCEATKVTALKIYFEHFVNVYQFSIEIKDSGCGKVVYQHDYPVGMTTQLMIQPYEQPGKSAGDNALTIDALSHKVDKKSSLDIKFTYRITTSTLTSVNSPSVTLPNCVIEPYGTIEKGEQGHEKAEAEHMAMLDDLLKKHAAKTQIGQSIMFHSYTSSRTIYVPVPSTQSSAGKGSGEQKTAQLKALESEDEPALKMQQQISNTSQKDKDEQGKLLSILQQELMDKISIQQALSGPNRLIQSQKLESLVTQIKTCFQTMHHSAADDDKTSNSKDSLEYLVTVASDVTKLIMYAKTSNNDLDLRSHFQKVNPDLAKVCLQLFSQFVVNETGRPRDEMITFLNNCFLSDSSSVLTDEERKTFLFSVLDKHLSSWESGTSQMQVLNALDSLKVNHKDLLAYMGSKLGLDNNDFKIEKSPVSMIYSVLTLVLRQVKKTKQPEITSQDSYDKCELFKENELIAQGEHYKLLFKTAVWLVKNKQNFFLKQEQIALLNTICHILTELGPIVKIDVLVDLFAGVATDQQKSVESLIIEVVCLDNEELMGLFSQIYEPLYQRQKKWQGIDNQSEWLKSHSTSHAQQLIKIVKSYQRHWLNILLWLVNIRLSNVDQSEEGKKQTCESQTKIVNLCANNKEMWMKKVTFAIDQYLQSQEVLRALQKQIEGSSSNSEKNGLPKLESADSASSTGKQADKAAEEKKDEAGASMQINTETTKDEQQTEAIVLIRSFLRMLQSPSAQSQLAQKELQQQPLEDFKETQQLWTLALRSLRTVTVQQLVEEKLLDTMIEAFLSSPEEIQQTTFAQILKISEMIALDDRNGSFLSNLLCTTLAKQMHSSQVVNAICQGWLDILIQGHCSSNQKDMPSTLPTLGANDIYAYLDDTVVSQLLYNSALYLTSYLNQGTFEGSAGAQQAVIMSLQMASDMLTVCLKAMNKQKRLTLASLYSRCQTDQQTADNLLKTFDMLITWLFMTGRHSQDESHLLQLGTQVVSTPATMHVSTITESVLKILDLVSDCIHNIIAIQFALKSLTQTVRCMNTELLARVSSGQLSFDMGLRLSNRTNELFRRLLKIWLVSDDVVNYFVFELRGFEFLLDTISSKAPTSSDQTDKASQKAQEGQSSVKQQVQDAMETQVSELEQLMLKQSQPSPSSEEQPASLPLSEMKPDDKEGGSEDTKVVLAEFGRQMKLKETNAPDQNINSYNTVDWAVNKRAYKHRQYTFPIKQSRGFIEHEMLFQLPSPVVVRELQMGVIINWQQQESELYLEPASILVQAGMSKDNLKHVCTLTAVKDNAFYLQCAAIFGKHMQHFEGSQNGQTKFTSISEAVKHGLDSLPSMKVKYIKFSLRKNVLSCMENSPYVTRMNKAQYFAINFISLTGYDTAQVKGDIAMQVQREQKKTAMEVMSLICSGEHSNALKVIANQPETIQKMKDEFDLLISLVNSSKGQIVEPTFVSIATHNSEMGDWIIEKFLHAQSSDKQTIDKQANLCAKIVVCDQAKVADRLQMVQDSIIEQLEHIAKNQANQTSRIEQLLPYIKIYIKSVHLVASEMGQDVFFSVSHAQIVVLAGLMNQQIEERKGQHATLKQFIVLMMSPPKPFYNKAMNPDALSDLLLNPSGSPSSEECHQMRQLAAVIATQYSNIALRISKELRGTLDEILTQKDNAPMTMTQQDATSWATFWLALAQVPAIKKQFQREQLPVQLYELIKEQQPAKDQTEMKAATNNQTRIIRKLPEDFLQILVELILTVAAGDDEIEQHLAVAVIQDMENMSKRDMVFINKILLPLIKNEASIPVCLFDKDNSGTWRPNLDLLLGYQDPNSTSNSSFPQDQNSSFLPSNLFDSEQRDSLMKGFKEIVGGVSNQQFNASMSAQWNLMHQTTTMQSPANQFPTLWRSLEGKGPMVMLVKGRNTKNKQMIFGGYCSKQMPAVPSDFDQEHEVQVSSSKEDFLFAHVEGEGWFWFRPMQDGQPIVEFFSDFEQGGAISMGSDFIIFSHSYDFQFTVGIYENLQTIPLTTVQQSTNTSVFDETTQTETYFKLEKAEIWTANLSAKGAPTGDLSASQQLKQKIIADLIPKDVNDVMASQPQGSNQMHPWVSPYSPYNLFRARSVFQVPAHITIRQLTECLLHQDTLALKHEFVDISLVDTVQDVYRKYMADTMRCEMSHNILDLTFLLQNIVPNDEASASNNSAKNKDKKGDEEGDDLGSRLATLYAPKSGFFTQFEDQGGVKLFIKVTLQSLEWWKDKKLAEEWAVWLKEVQSFTEIKIYFQMFLKSNFCRELLFEVLRGEPDSDNSAYDKAGWQERQKQAVQKNYKILSEVFAIPDNPGIREQAIKAGFLPRFLERLSIISGEKPRILEEEESESEEDISQPLNLERQQSSEQNKDKKKKRKGVGYVSGTGVTFNVNEHLASKAAKSEQIKILIDICTNFFNTTEQLQGEHIQATILESCLLPLLENAFRNDSWLDMVKDATLYHSCLALTRAFACQQQLIPCLKEIDKKYKPQQTTPIYTLLKRAKEQASSFKLQMAHIASKEEDSENADRLARDVIRTFEVVYSAINNGQSEQQEDIVAEAMKLPLQGQYRKLLQSQRFDYMDMKDKQTQQYKHFYKKEANSSSTPPSKKLLRLVQEFVDLSNSLPTEHTNAVYVRVDKSRIDLMKAVITGASGTPYAHGVFEFDLYFNDNYPKDPPKMNLMTTGFGQIRFNPNLYACGKVCLSLINTWRGSETEKWQPEVSTAQQVLVSVQAIIMSEEVYFNEPSYENERGTPDGEKRNEAYMSVVRYGNVKFAMLGQLKNPSKGFETMIKWHFYVKKEEILQTVHKWVERADKVECLYQGLVMDHNQELAKTFSKSKTKYREMLQQVVTELEEELNKLERPKMQQIKPKQAEETQKETAKLANIANIAEGQANLANVDVTDLAEGQISTMVVKDDVNVEDEAFKDLMSRYLGTMGMETVKKQFGANVFMSGVGALGIEIAKNMVLSGCKSFTLHDSKKISVTDLAGQFFIEPADLEKNKDASRVATCLMRLQQLNAYVRCKDAPFEPIPLTEEGMEKEPWCFQNYDIVILTEASHETIIAVNNYCHKRGKKFISADCYGVFGRVFNDFGKGFEVLDKNGEELQDCMIKTISCEEEGVVVLLDNAKHKFEDGDEVLFTGVEGMTLKEGMQHAYSEEAKDDQPAGMNFGSKSTSINNTLHKVRVMTPFSFKIGDTRMYTQHKGNGLAKQLKPKLNLEFKTFSETMVAKEGEPALPLDMNMMISDFEKMSHPQIEHIAFEALDRFKKQHQRMPGVWHKADADDIYQKAEEIAQQMYKINTKEDWKEDGIERKLIYLFAFQCQGTFNPMCAFFGGYIAQEIIKGITGKFTPTNQLFHYNAIEVLPAFDPSKDLSTFEEFRKTLKLDLTGHRSDGLKICLAGDLLEKIEHTRLFMVGAGAIGCELLKNYAMMGVGTGKENKDKQLKAGQIVLTDPDVIEVSNLNRQFLFRAKHLRQSKSQTAAAAAIKMNPDLKDNVVARLEKVWSGTANIFHDQFFEELTIVTNALDNIQARKYIDSRCVTAQTPLLESGTLGPKGHVQVILPHLTESYGQQEDPDDAAEVPFCTLKMFPEETLHCVEWARDKFSKLFSQYPQSTVKLLEEGQKKEVEFVSQQDIQMLKEGVKMLKKRPVTFDDCIEWSRLKFEKLYNHDMKQLLHTYPLDCKTKEGALFWSLPKRAPTPVVFDAKDILHCSFIASTACLRATVFFVEIPSKEPRSEAFKFEVGAKAATIKVPDFVPNDEKSKAMQDEVDKNTKSKEKQAEEEDDKEEEKKEEKPEVEEDKVDIWKAEFTKFFSELKIVSDKPIDEHIVRAEVFEKDNDANYHIDMIYSMANVRSSCYALDPMDWLTVKLKAGRIVPAMATTTSSIAGLQALELVKVLKGSKKEDFRNIFLNLAVPLMQAGEPGDLIKTKLLDGLEVSLWDRWEVKGSSKSLTLQAMIKKIEQQYKGLEVRDVMRGNQPIYFSGVIANATQNADILGSLIHQLANCSADDSYVDLTVTCVYKEGTEQKLLQGVPPVRVLFIK